MTVVVKPATLEAYEEQARLTWAFLIAELRSAHGDKAEEIAKMLVQKSPYDEDLEASATNEQEIPRVAIG